MIDMASVYAERYKQNPQALQAAVMGQSPDPKLDPYTALNALKLVKESARMAMVGQAQQPTSSPSIVAENVAPPPMMQGLGAMVPGAMGQAPQGMPQPTMQAASGGLAGMYTPEEDYAAGGIIAFNGEDNSYVGGELTVPPDTPYDPEETGLYAENAAGDGGTDDQRTQVFNNYLASRKMIADTPTDDMSTTDLAKERRDYLKFITDNAGPNIYDPANKRLTERETARTKNTSQGQGLALLAAAGAILEGNTMARGASKAFPAFAKEMGEVQRADIAEQRSIESMQFSLADAQRKERMGDVRGAQASAESARKLKADVNRSRLNKAQALSNLDARAMQALRTTSKGAGAGPKYQEQILQNNIDYLRTTQKLKEGETPEAFDARVRKMAGDVTAAQLKTSYSTGEIGAVNAETRLAPVQQRIDADVVAKLGEFKDNDSGYRAARRAKNTTEMNRLLAAEETKLRAAYQTPTAAPAKPSAAPAAAAAATSKVLSQADVDATVKSSGRTRQEVMDALKAKGYTVK